MVMNGDEGLGYEAQVDGVRLEHVSEFLDDVGTDGAECSRKVAHGRRVGGAIRFLVNARDLQIECARVLKEALLVPVHSSETVLWKEKENCRIMAGQMGSLIGLRGIRRMDRVPSARVRELCGVTKG